MNSTQSSFYAGEVSLKTSKTLRATRKMIPMYDKAVDDFNSNVEKILNKEINRLEEERLLAEAIEANAGKDLDFF